MTENAESIPMPQLDDLPAESDTATLHTLTPPKSLTKDEAFTRSEGPWDFEWTRKATKKEIDEGMPGFADITETVTLHKLDTYRLNAAESIGLQLFQMTPEQLGASVKANSYPGVMADAMVVSFLCSQPDELAKKAFQNPRFYKDMAFEWAAKYGINMFSEAGQDCVSFFMDRIEELEVSDSESDPTGAGGGGNMGEPSGTSPTL